MSTNINISVGDNKLLEQARQQQAASRQAQLEKEATKRLEAQATAERTKTLATQGKDANGNPLTGTSSQTPQVERRPAANRLGGKDFFLVRPSAAIDLATYQTPAEKNLGWPKYMSQSPAAYQTLLFEPNGGPNNSTAFVVNKQQNEFTEIIAQHPSAENIRYYKTQVENATLEFYIYFGNTLPLPAAQLFGGINRHKFYWKFGNRGLLELFVSHGNYRADGLYYDMEIFASVRQSNTSNYVDAAADVFTTEPQNYNPANYRLIAPWSQAPFQGQSWYHLALVKNQRNLNFFIDGVLYSQVSLSFDYIELLPVNAELGQFNFTTFMAQVDSQGAGASLGSKIHGLRFTPKALYTANFTPPLNL